MELKLRKKLKFKNILIFVIFVSAFTCIFMLIKMIYESSMEESAETLAKMPCNDFYEYVCDHTQRQQNTNDNSLAIQKSLNMKPESGDDQTAYSKARTFYQSCTKRGKPTKSFLNSVIEEFGGWRLTGNFNTSITFNERVQNIQKKLFIPPLFNWFVEEQAGQKKFSIAAGGVSTAENGGLQNLENLLDILDQKDNYNLADLEEIIELERAFDVIMQNLIKERDYLYFLTSYDISEMLDKFPFLQWDNFFEFIEAGNCKNLDHCTIKEILVQENFLSNVNQLLMKYFDEKKQHVIENYMMWRILVQFNPNYVNPWIRYVLSTCTRMDCLTYTEILLSPIITSMFIKEKGAENIQKEQKLMTETVKSFKEIFEENFNTIQWMDPESKQNAKAKLEHMEYHIGHTELSDEELEFEYENLSVKPNYSYYENELHIGNFFRKKLIQNLSKPPVKGVMSGILSFFPYLSVRNAHHNVLTNKIRVPIRRNLPLTYKSHPFHLFGDIWSVIGHEISHGFDDKGVMYDSLGNKKSLYSNSGLKALQNVSNCLRHQYSTYNLNGRWLDGNFTLTENIADHGALRIAEIAFERRLRNNHNSDEMIPGLTAKQSFYIWFTKHDCRHYPENFIGLDPHSPNKFRVNGPLKNSAKFAETWGCKSGTPMNPKNKCSFWGI